MTQDSLCNLVISNFFLSFLLFLLVLVARRDRRCGGRVCALVNKEGDGGDHGSASGGDGGTMEDQPLPLPLLLKSKASSQQTTAEKIVTDWQRLSDIVDVVRPRFDR